MSSGMTVDRVVQVGRSGAWAEFSLGHGWASGEPDEAPESCRALYYGFREDVDPERRAAFPELTPDRWPSRETVGRRIAQELEERNRLHPGLWSFDDVAYSVTGHPRMVEALSSEPAGLPPRDAPQEDDKGGGEPSEHNPTGTAR